MIGAQIIVLAEELYHCRVGAMRRISDLRQVVAESSRGTEEAKVQEEEVVDTPEVLGRWPR